MASASARCRLVPSTGSVQNCGSLNQSRGVENRVKGQVGITRLVFTHSGKSSLPTNLRHFSTTSCIFGRFFGFCCQQLLSTFHISTVSPSAPAFRGISGLPPREMRSTTGSFFFSPNGTLPVNTSTASIAKAKTSAAFDSSTGTVPRLRGGVIISGAGHTDAPTSPDATATVKLGSKLMGANPYSVKRG